MNEIINIRCLKRKKRRIALTFPFPVLSTIAVMLGKTDRHITNVMNTETIQTHIFLMMNKLLVGI